MKIREILKVKGNNVYTIVATATVDAAVRALVDHNCGSLVVCDDSGKMIGIITERDILRACAANPNGLTGLLVRDHMTKSPLKGGPDDANTDVMSLMTENRIRHLPIESEGELVGLISIGDLVKAQQQHLSAENHLLKTYIQS